MSAKSSLFHRRGRDGFTLVEIMVVIIIIGLIAALAIPTIMRARSNAQNARFISDLRQARSVFENYALQNGDYPPAAAPGTVITGMEEELANLKWTEPTAVGGAWTWTYNSGGVIAAVGVSSPTASAGQMAKIDAHIDDGNLSTGLFRSGGGGYMLVIEE
jgi:prepilin-type N-terminal cleavage/methylation domain-containing protein